MNRHLWANHIEYARRNRIPTEHEKCIECGKTMRRDNLKRHMARHIERLIQADTP